MNVKNIFLIGPMGAGKTSIGRQLARKLQWEFFDSDLVVQERTGVDISWIFDTEGEQGFRKREREAIADLTKSENIVLATGGGAILAEENRTNLAKYGTVIYLSASIAQQLQRTQYDKTRPLLQRDDVEDVLQCLAIERNPLYAELADCRFDTNKRSVHYVVGEIVKMVTEPPMDRIVD